MAHDIIISCLSNEPTSYPIPKDVHDSFASEQSYIVHDQRPTYNYSPEYRLIVDPKAPVSSNFPQKVQEYYESLDDEEESNFDTITHNINKYNIDTSKINSKMHDVGFSPYKQKRTSSQLDESDYLAAVP